MADEEYFANRKHLLGNLKRTDWDAFRGNMLRTLDIFDELLSEAEDRPVNILSSKEGAARYAVEVGQLLLEIERQHSASQPFALITGREDDGVEVAWHKTRSNAVDDIANLLTTGYELLAIVENGVPWSYDLVEKVKLEAVSKLNGISRAKAEGRFFV